jgi:hypothetical protein
VLRRSSRLVSPVEGCPARCKRILTARNELGMESSFTLALRSVSGSCPVCSTSCRARRFFVAVPGVPDSLFAITGIYERWDTLARKTAREQFWESSSSFRAVPGPRELKKN